MLVNQSCQCGACQDLIDIQQNLYGFADLGHTENELGIDRAAELRGVFDVDRGDVEN